jgi:hypothetical protein
MTVRVLLFRCLRTGQCFFFFLSAEVTTMKQVTRASLELDDEHEPTTSLADAAVCEGVEDEKCVVAVYRTTDEDVQDFKRLLATSDREAIPIEWVIDIADESNGWFYATAYHYNDETNMLHVMVPDKENPTFDGDVQLDHRTVHLIECVDGKSMALYKKIVRQSVCKIRWDVEWFEESADDQGMPIEGSGYWLRSLARYYIRIVNQLLVEDRADDQDGRGFVIITADLNVRLLECNKGRGAEDFNRLILENVVLSSPAALEAAQTGSNLEEPEKEAVVVGTSDSAGRHNSSSNNHRDSHASHSNSNNRDKDNNREASKDRESSRSSGTRKLADYARQLRECIVDIADHHDNKKTEAVMVADLFHAFILDGDLDEGTQLMQHFEKVRHTGMHSSGGENANNSDEDVRMDVILDDARVIAGKLEKHLQRMVKSPVSDDPDKLVQKLKKMEKEINEIKRHY